MKLNFKFSKRDIVGIIIIAIVVWLAYNHIRINTPAHVWD